MKSSIIVGDVYLKYMVKQIVFTTVLIITLAIFFYSVNKLYKLFRITRSAYKVRDFGKRIMMTLNVAIFQTKILRNPVIGFIHALVFWGFCVICLGSIEMILDGMFGLHQSLSFMGPVYSALTALIDVFAYVIAVAIIIFLVRRIFHIVKRFNGVEMTPKTHVDANFALSLILLLMLSLIGMNFGLIGIETEKIIGWYPVTELLYPFNSLFSVDSMYLLYEINWWIHILLIFLFANYLPYSKHFHVFMSVPNVFFSRLEPLGKLPNMDNVTKEVKLMLDPNLAFSAPAVENEVPARFGVLDIEDVTWKIFIDSLSCTQCGRCTSVCPANITGKKLSPRKLFIDLRKRMNEKGYQIVKNGNDFTDGKSLIGNYISEEELWACTTCNACAKECPVNINHPTFIVDMRRYLVMEKAAAPTELNSIFSNIENNGAPWQFSPEDRLLWTE